MGRSVVVVGFTAAALACGATPAPDTAGGQGQTTAPLASSPTDGIATFYDADGSGNCSFDPSPNDLDVTAMAMPEYAGSAACGACLRVTGPDASVTVRVVDSCPECASKGVNLDLSASAFAKIAKPSLGRISIRYQLVACAVSGNLAYHFKDGSSKYWTAIQVRNHAVPVAKLEVRKGGAYADLSREDYNYFVAASGVGDQPSGLALRVTSSDGRVVEDVLPLPEGIPANATIDGTKQF